MSLLLFIMAFILPPTLVRVPYNAHWETSAVTPEIQNILQQPFTYLAKGNQTYVFVSEDEKYVLKLFRYTRSRFPIVHSLKQWFAKKTKNDFYTKLQKTFLAAKIASEEGQEFTQVVYCHLNQTENAVPVVTIDKTYKLPLDKYRFVLQKKAEGFGPTLLGAKNDPERMEKLLISFAELIEKRSSQGIRNSDPNLLPNFGFIRDKAVEIDFGNYRKPVPYDEQLRRSEMENLRSRLHRWLAKNDIKIYNPRGEAPK